MKFTVNIKGAPEWGFNDDTVSISVNIEMKVNDQVLKEESVFTKVPITEEDWKQHGYDVITQKILSRFGKFKSNYRKIMEDTGFSSPEEIVNDLMNHINNNLAGA